MTLQVNTCETELKLKVELVGRLSSNQIACWELKGKHSVWGFFSELAKLCHGVSPPPSPRS